MLNLIENVKQIALTEVIW